MLRFFHNQKQWLLPATLILFILEIFTLPFVLGMTYSGRSEAPDHVLTYTQNKLTWDSATGIAANGVAELDLFNAIYDNVSAWEKDNVIAPGTDGYNIVRLKNNVSGEITYTAVFYSIKSTENLPITPELIGTSYTDTTTYPLPEGVKREQVLRAVTGKLGGGQRQDFDISWVWNFYEDDHRDTADTQLGDKAVIDIADNITVGIYIVVEDGNSYVSPEIPKTGDDSMLVLYFALMGVSGLMLILLIFDRRREEKCVS